MGLATCSSTIDWAATGKMLQGIGTIAGVGAVVWAAIKGANTFDAWRTQKLTERKLEQAEQILVATYQARRGLEYVRGAMMWANELGAAEDQVKANDWWDAQTEAKQKRLVTAQAYYNRISCTKGEREALDQCLPMARALFGEELEQAIENLNRQFWIVQVDVESYVDDEGGTDREFTRKIRRGMYAVKPPEGEVNEITEAMKAAVATIERICIPIVRLDFGA